MEKKIDPARLNEEGYCIVRKLINQDWLDKLIPALEKAFEQHRTIQVKNGNDIITGGVALHVALSDQVFLDFLKHLLNTGFVADLREHFFRSKFILNSFSGLNNLPHQLNFSSIVHRDLRF